MALNTYHLVLVSLPSPSLLADPEIDQYPRSGSRHIRRTPLHPYSGPRSAGGLHTPVKGVGRPLPDPCVWLKSPVSPTAVSIWSRRCYRPTVQCHSPTNSIGLQVPSGSSGSPDPCQIDPDSRPERKVYHLNSFNDIVNLCNTQTKTKQNKIPFCLEDGIHPDEP